MPSILRLVFFDPGDQIFGETANLPVFEQSSFDEVAYLVGGSPRVLLDLVKNLKSDLTALRDRRVMVQTPSSALSHF